MNKHIRIKGVRRKTIDEDKLALAFLLLAKTLHKQPSSSDSAAKPTGGNGGEPDERGEEQA